MTKTLLALFRANRCCVLPLLFVTGFVLGQQQLYTGNYEINGYSGQATYTYKVEGIDTIRDGSFTMQRSNLQALLKEQDSTFSFTGSFSEDRPVGRWKFQFGNFTSNQTAQVDGFQYKINVTGTQEEAFGSLSGGKPQGPWVIQVNAIDNSVLGALRFKSEFVFDNGIPQQSFKIADENTTLVGRFLRNGLAHDEWTLFSNDVFGATENWYFSEGILQKVVREDMEGTKTVTFANKSGIDFKTIPLDGRFSTVLKIKTSPTDIPITSGLGINGFLEENAAYYQKIATLFKGLGEPDFKPGFKIKVAHYPLDQNAQTKLEETRLAIAVAESISEALLNNSQLNILKLSDPKADEYYSIIQVLHEQYVQPLQKMVAYDDQEVLPLVSRKELITHLWPEGVPTTTIDLPERNTAFKGPNADAYDFSGYTIATIDQIAQYALASLQQVSSELNEKLGNTLREQQQQALESQLVVLVDSLQKFADSVQPSLPSDYAKSLVNSAKVANQIVQIYAEASTDEVETTTAQGLIACLEQLNELAVLLSTMPERVTAIKAMYTDRVWNPFMATLMDELQKKRIVNAYENIVVPYFLNRTTNALDCDTVGRYIDQIKTTNARMDELLEEDTSKLERKLRKVQDPETVLQLFNISIPNN